MTRAILVSQNQHRDTVRENIRSGAVLSSAYLMMNVLAATIASYGLFANSPAVVISAMIVAMLLGPIMGVLLSWVSPLRWLWSHRYLQPAFCSHVEKLIWRLVPFC